MTAKDSYNAWLLMQAQELFYLVKEKDITQKKLSELTGYSLKTISNILNYKHLTYEVVWCCMFVINNSKLSDGAD
jgi:plasmid maintenance system antidote protein VapI